MRRETRSIIVGMAVAAFIAFAGHRFYVQRRVQNEIAKLKHGGGQERTDAAYALGRLGRPAVQPLRELLHSEDVSIRGYAFQALGYVGPQATPAVPEMVAMLQSNGPADGALYETGWHLFDFWGRIGPGAQPSVPFLGELLGHSNASVRVYAAKALWSINRDPRSVPTLVDVLRTTPEVNNSRLYAYMTLETIGPDARAAVPALVVCIREPSLGIYALRALASIGPAAADAVPALNDLALSGTNAIVHRATVEALQKIGMDHSGQHHITSSEDTMSYALDISGEKMLTNPSEADIRAAVLALDTSKSAAFLILGKSTMTYIQTGGDAKSGGVSGGRHKASLPGEEPPHCERDCEGVGIVYGRLCGVETDDRMGADQMVAMIKIRNSQTTDCGFQAHEKNPNDFWDRDRFRQ